MRLAHKVFVVIGGTSGLGLSAARAFVTNGARVVVVGRKESSCQKAQELLGDSGLAMPGDAIDPRTATTAIETALQKFGGFHGLYHVAGGSGRAMGDGPLHTVEDSALRATLELNLHSLFFSNRAAVRQFLKQGGGGVVLNMSSVLAYSPSPKYFATHVYAMAKSAVLGLVKAAAAQYAPANIRINAILPALTDTPMAERAMQNSEIIDFVRRKQPLGGGRPAVPQDLDGAAVFLMSDEASFVTGQFLAVDGGWSCVEPV